MGGVELTTTARDESEIVVKCCYDENRITESTNDSHSVACKVPETQWLLKTLESISEYHPHSRRFAKLC